jgi:hypothetical protein
MKKRGIPPTTAFTGDYTPQNAVTKLFRRQQVAGDYTPQNAAGKLFRRQQVTEDYTPQNAVTKINRRLAESAALCRYMEDIMAIDRVPVSKRCNALGISPAVIGYSLKKETVLGKNLNTRKKVSE